jgi:hypothetical protein
MQKWEYCYVLQHSVREDVIITYYKPDGKHVIQTFLDRQIASNLGGYNGLYATWAWLGLQGWEMVDHNHFKRPLQDENV